MEERFWSKVNIRGDDECWEWTTTSRHGFGYGMFWLHDGMKKAHRVAWMLTNGPITDGGWVCHHCDNPPCCNPSHLYLGNRKTNAEDKSNRGRASMGGRRVLSDDDYTFIRMWIDLGYTQKEVADTHRITQSWVSRIVNYVTIV